MTQEVVKTNNLGDIKFGLPDDIAPDQVPWAYYQILGVDRTASADDIKAAVKELALKYHPDKHAQDGEDAVKHATEQMQLVNDISHVLLDDGGDLGAEHSKRAQYDSVSEFCEYFPGFIKHQGDRTRSFAEIKLIRMEGHRKSAENELRMEQNNPEIMALLDEMKKAVEADDDEAYKNVKDRLHEQMAEDQGVSVDEIEAYFEKMLEAYGEAQRKHSEKIESGFRKVHRYRRKVLDIYHIGGGTVGFCAHASHTQFGAIDMDDRAEVLEVLTGANCNFGGFGKVHLKAEEATVRISTPHTEGVFHVGEGRVEVRYEGTSYANVIRVKAPKITIYHGFVRKGDLFIPKRFANTPNWEQREPAVDIAVREGTVMLKCASQDFARPRYQQVIGSGSSTHNLDGLVGGYYTQLHGGSSSFREGTSNKIQDYQISPQIIDNNNKK